MDVGYPLRNRHHEKLPRTTRSPRNYIPASSGMECFLGPMQMTPLQKNMSPGLDVNVSGSSFVVNVSTHLPYRRRVKFLPRYCHRENGVNRSDRLISRRGQMVHNPLVQL